ncbi:piggyBac transposable element-derived protein 4-like [Uloborus diversus]|uniref:piggyBac transposable element-derived protein 4-like n=1 Tax=Uloborus diversus TaxID=327109 RepID=UPI00240963B7|nr:piggyBac transposable element-derived protein 4-like [Uloborus diversus]
MYRRKGLTDEEIQKLMQELDDENYADSESDCEEEDESFMQSELIDGNEENIIVAPEFPESSFEVGALEKWDNPKVSDSPMKFQFTSHVGVKVSVEELQEEKDYFNLIFTNDFVEFLCKETNRYASQTLQPVHLGKRKHVLEWKPCTTEELKRFIALTLLMGHIDKDDICEYWSKDELIETPIFGKSMSRDRYLQILKFLHFANNENSPDRNDPNYDRLWKIREVFDHINLYFRSLYDPTEELSIDEVIVKFKGRCSSRTSRSLIGRALGVIGEIFSVTALELAVGPVGWQETPQEKPQVGAGLMIGSSMEQETGCLCHQQLKK